jgi:hypothetical protein
MGQRHVPWIQNRFGFHARENVFELGGRQPAGFGFVQTGHDAHPTSPFAKGRPHAMTHAHGALQVDGDTVIKKTVQGNRKSHFGQPRVHVIYRERPEGFSCLPRHPF